MNWILKNKKTASGKLVDNNFAQNKIISQSKKAKALLVVLFLVCGLLFLSLNDVKAAADAATQNQTMPDFASQVFVNAIKAILIQVFSVCGWLFAIAATLFAWVIDPNNVSGANGMLNKQAVKDVWIMVRDLLNMTFILILLFAAFCTIFRVDKWNLKKVWLNILINALMVNFSFPIARFFIDISNVAFYYFVNHLFSSTGVVTGNSIFANLGEVSKFGSILQPEQYAKADISYIVAMIVLTFILGMTLMVIAALFVVRLIALTLLVMFSPVGFVGYIFPATSSYADKWWKQLFSYSFFAPIMIFMMAIALRIMEVMGNENFNSMLSNASANTTEQANWIASASFFMIPIIILWMGMGMAKSIGIEGADKVVDSVKKGGKWIANAPGKYSGVYGATKKATEDFNKKGRLLGMKVPLMGSEGREAREAAMAGFVTGGAGGRKNVRQKAEDKDVADKIKEYKERNYTTEMISKDLLDPKSDKVKQKAAMQALLGEKGALGADPDRMIKALSIAGSDMALRNKIIESSGDFAGNDAFTHTKLNLVLNAATAGLAAGSQQEKDISGKIRGKVMQENAKKLIDYEISKGKGADVAHNEILGELTAQEFGKQKGLHENVGTPAGAELETYIRNNVAPDTTFHQELFKHMKKSDRAKYASNHLAP